MMKEFIHDFDLTATIQGLLDSGVHVGLRLLGAVVTFVVGRYLIKWLNRLFSSMLQRRRFDPSVQSFLKSLINILLMVMLFLAILGQLGIELTGFAALIASAGVAIGMALSGQLQNIAGGIIVLLFRPYKVGDYISSSGIEGTVMEIQIFHTVVVTADNKVVYVPNGSMSSAMVTNYNRMDKRRVEWVFGVEYGEDLRRVRQVLNDCIVGDKRILTDPKPFIELAELASSSVDVKVRVWVPTADYWNVYFEFNAVVYEAFNEAGIGFPYPHLTINREA
ncbi:MAG: mechanosensitive ion channel [Bacteroidales bacterium]|nr:mechanosensitive ion channel [Bacteroidales bacterium]